MIFEAALPQKVKVANNETYNSGTVNSNSIEDEELLLFAQEAAGVEDVEDIDAVNNDIEIEEEPVSENKEVQNTSDTTETEETNPEADALRESLDETKSEQGFIGKAWDGIKNFFGFGASSNKAEQAIKDFEAGKISYEEAQERVNDYADGQKDSVEFVGDVLGVVASVALVALVPGLGVAAATILSGGICAATKAGVKYADAKVGGRDYTGKDLAWDAASGFVSGALSVVGGKIAGKVAAKCASKFPVFGKMASALSNGGSLPKAVKAFFGITDDLAEVAANKGLGVAAEKVAKATVGNLAGDLNKGILMGGLKTAKGMVLDGEEFSMEECWDNIKTETIKYAGFARVFGNLTSYGLSCVNDQFDIGDSKLANKIEDIIKDISKKAVGGQSTREYSRDEHGNFLSLTSGVAFISPLGVLASKFLLEEPKKQIA